MAARVAKGWSRGVYRRVADEALVCYSTGHSMCALRVW